MAFYGVRHRDWRGSMIAMGRLSLTEGAMLIGLGESESESEAQNKYSGSAHSNSVMSSQDAEAQRRIYLFAASQP
jgi:hypothetical protein